MKGERQILYYRNYFIDFFWSLDSGARFNGFQKKTQKTPETEIDKALQIQKEYYASK